MYVIHLSHRARTKKATGGPQSLAEVRDTIADYDAALNLNPQLASSRYGRGIAKRQKGDLVGASVDIAAARAIKADVAEDYARYGIQ